MIDEIEIAPSNHTARCVRCGNKIKRLQIRGKRSHVKAHPEYICERCLKKEIENIDDKILEIKKEFRRLLNMSDEKKEEQLNRLKILRELE